MTHRYRLWLAGLKGLGGAVIATLAVRWVALTTLEIPTEFPPLAGPGPTLFFTAVSGLVAIGVFALVRRHAARAERLFRRVAVAVLLLTFGPDFCLLNAGPAEAVPGTAPAAVGVLMVMHVVAAGVIVWFLTRGSEGEHSA